MIKCDRCRKQVSLMCLWEYGTSYPGKKDALQIGATRFAQTAEKK